MCQSRASCVRFACALVVSACLSIAASSPRVLADDAQAPETLAHQILDGNTPNAAREAIIKAHPELSAKLIETMARGLGTDAKEEYRRIPWIWRVAIAAGRRNDAAEVRGILDVALPQAEQPLRDWQAVVVGGGLVNGISQAGSWPDERLDGLLAGKPELKGRWRRCIDLAARMADDRAVATGTRYDALRILGADGWQRRGAQVFGYLLKGVHSELQQGAISALADMRSAAAGQALLSGLEHYSQANRKLMLEALLRDDTRREALLDAVAAGRLKRSDLGDQTVHKLTDPSQRGTYERARQLLLNER